MRRIGAGIMCALITVLGVFGQPVPGPLEHPAGSVPIDFYYSEGCRSCLEFLEETIPEISEETGVAVSIKTFDLLTPNHYEHFRTVISKLDVEVTEVPIAIIGSVVLQGDDEIRRELEGVLVSASTEAGIDASGAAGGGDDRLLALPVFGAGLLDGINPCAFTTLIFLLAALAVAGRSRHEVFVLGLFFSISVFVTYFLIGLGFFQAIRAATSFPVIAEIITWVLFATLLVFAGLSLYDWTKIRRGRASDIVLQLPMAMKRRIHGSIRTYARSTALAGSALILGVLVSVFELACTGQIYFPTLAYLARVDADLRTFLLLGLYNLGFILPLLVVFALSYAGVSSQRITQVFQRNLGLVKLATAGLFTALAVLTVTL